MVSILLTIHDASARVYSPDAASEQIFTKLKTIKFDAIKNPNKKIKDLKASRLVRQELKESLHRMHILAFAVPQYVKDAIRSKKRNKIG